MLIARRTLLFGLGLLTWTAPLGAQTYVPRLAFQQELGAGDKSAATEGSAKPEELPPKAAKPANSQPQSMNMPASSPPPSWQLPIQYNRCNFSACNLPPQPDAPVGRCQPCIRAVDCANSPYPQKWCDALPYNFGPLGHGEHMGPVRLPSTNDVRLRVNDRLRFSFIESRRIQASQYRLMVGDELMIESVTDKDIKLGDLNTRTGVQIQPDGFLYLKLIGMVRAEGLTIEQLRKNLEIAYKGKIITPAIDVTPVKTNSRLASYLATVDTRGNQGGGQTFADSVHQDGTIRIPGIGSVCVLGMTLDEVKREVNLRLAEEVWGLEVEPAIESEAPHFIFVYGEVNKPDRYQLNGPTTVSQALAMAGSIKVGGNQRSVVIFRKMEDWRMVATQVDLKGQYLGRVMTPKDDIWLRDNDLLIVPPMPIKVFDNFVKLVFTDGIYGIVPFGGFSITKFQQAGIN